VLYNALQSGAIPLAERYYTARAVEHDAQVYSTTDAG
jgi:hypothetical protein